MLTNSELAEIKNPLKYAKGLQDKLNTLQETLDGLTIEYNQVVLHCREKNIMEMDEYSLSITKKSTYKINPQKFAELFPDVNSILVKRELAYMTSEIKHLQDSKILSAITKKDVGKQVGKRALIPACDVSVSETIKVIEIKTGSDIK
jgi:hypothetical protein